MATTKKSKTKEAAVASPPVGDVAAAEKFKRDLLIRGDAAQLDERGKLPASATHEIVQDKGADPSTTRIVRRRFKMF